MIFVERGWIYMKKRKIKDRRQKRRGKDGHSTIE
jgi:cytochrome oxidase assembly protein ShyY1